jgi:hypothetical protein
MIWYRNDSESLQTHCANRNRRQKLYRNKQASTQHLYVYARNITLQGAFMQTCVCY